MVHVRCVTNYNTYLKKHQKFKKFKIVLRTQQTTFEWISAIFLICKKNQCLMQSQPNQRQTIQKFMA